MTTPLLTCPYCGESFAAEAVQEGRDLAEYLSILAGFGSYACTVRDYIGLFKAKPGSKQRLSTKLKVARELDKLWRAGEFSYRGAVYHLDRTHIADALHRTVQQMAGQCGFNNHNYLKKVMLPEARRKAVKEEHALEAARQSGQHRQQKEQMTVPVEDGRPVWEQSLEVQAVTYATIKSNKMMMSAMEDTLNRLALSLGQAGYSLEKLAQAGREAKSPAELSGKGAELLQLCRVDVDSQPAPVGECLPELE